MSLILHLSDVHLGSPSDSQLDSTDKFGLDGPGETKIDHLKRTLRALGVALDQAGRALDAVIVSGDLTNANQQDGYDALADLLAELGGVMPDSGNILIVPGNHDADWDVQPGNKEKFRRFLKAVRKDYKSPLISGLDYNDNHLTRGTGSLPKANPVLELNDVAILGLNSADYCGVEERKSKTDWDAVVASYLRDERTSSDDQTRSKAEEKAGRAKVDLRRLRVRDMARVEPRQLEALTQRLAGTSFEREADQDVRLRIAVLHHPISPVTDHEEIKAFESLTNLASVRGFLFDQQIHVVLHGHKHESFMGWDWLLPPSPQLGPTPWRTLVIGAPGDFKRGHTVCRLLEVCPDPDVPVAGAPRLRVTEIKGVRASEALTVLFADPPISLAQPFVRSEDIGSPWVVRARHASAAYQQLRDLPTSLAVPRTVVSVVEEAGSAFVLPQNYPENRNDAWLSDLVRWWQLERPEAVRAFVGSKFNHGERLYADADAIKIAANALPSSKAIALLVHREEAGSPHLEYPAFTAVQFQARTVEGVDGPRLTPWGSIGSRISGSGGRSIWQSSLTSNGLPSLPPAEIPT